MGGGGVRGGGRKESCSSRLTFLQYPSPTPSSQPLVSLQRSLLWNKVCIETSVHSLASS